MKHYKVYLEDSLHEAVKKVAGDVPVSAWFRTLAIANLMWTSQKPEVKIQGESFPRGTMLVKTAVSDIELKPPKVTVHLVHCEHGETAFNCKKWGCKFYEIANGRK